MQSRHGSSVVTSVTSRRFTSRSATSSGCASSPSPARQCERATTSPLATTIEPIGSSPASSPSAASSSAASISSKELEDTQRPSERRNDVHAGSLLARRCDQLARMREPDVRRIRARRLERVLQLLRHDDARHLVVQANGQPVTRQRKDTEQDGDRPRAAEPLRKLVEVVEI